MHIDGRSPGAKRQLAINCLVETVNDLDRDMDLVMQTLIDNNYLGASDVSAKDIKALQEGGRGLATLLRSLSNNDAQRVAAGLNAELRKQSVSPQLCSHNGIGLHVHWTDESTPFHDRVLVDLLMTLADVLSSGQEDRFGVCDAARCERLFYDHTRNRSRRFCSDPTCANRTHVAEHRKRQSG